MLVVAVSVALTFHVVRIRLQVVARFFHIEDFSVGLVQICLDLLESGSLVRRDGVGDGRELDIIGPFPGPLLGLVLLLGRWLSWSLLLWLLLGWLLWLCFSILLLFSSPSSGRLTLFGLLFLFLFLLFLWLLCGGGLGWFDGYLLSLGPCFSHADAFKLGDLVDVIPDSDHQASLAASLDVSLLFCSLSDLVLGNGLG